MHACHSLPFLLVPGDLLTSSHIPENFGSWPSIFASKHRHHSRPFEAQVSHEFTVRAPDPSAFSE